MQQDPMLLMGLRAREQRELEHEREEAERERELAPRSHERFSRLVREATDPWSITSADLS